MGLLDPDLSVKEEVVAMIRRLPDNCTLEDIQYHMYVFEQMAEAEKDSREGRVVTQEEARELLRQWHREDDETRQKSGADGRLPGNTRRKVP